MFQDLLDDTGRMHVLHSEKGEFSAGGFRQSGEFEKHILCLDCDNNRLGKLDRYASLTLYGGTEKLLAYKTEPVGLRHIYCAGLNYHKFKLFLLSVLWRASISERSIFQEVDLGPYEERIRRMILADDPGRQLQYPCLISSYVNNDEFPHDFVGQPSRGRTNGGYFYHFLIAGLVYTFFVTRRIVPDWLEQFAINPTGEMRILYTPPSITRNIFSTVLGVRL